MISRWISERPHDLAVVDATTALTWTQLDERVSTHARTLDSLGAARRVVLHLPQSAEALAALLACARRGVDAILVSALYPEARAQVARDVSGAQAVLALDGMTLVTREPLRALPAPRPDGDPLVGVLTSGSTGAPKCAQHTWRTLTARVKASVSRLGKRWLLCYPLSHIAALQVVAQVLTNRGTLVIPADFGAAAASEAIRRHQVQCMSSTPTFTRQLLHGAPPELWAEAHLEQIILGGETVDQAVLDGLRRVAPQAQLTHIYATTELGAVIVVTDGREGFPSSMLDGERLRVTDGKLEVRRSGASMRGYFGRDDDDAGAEWWPTGDLIALDGDRARFTGREADLINVGGYKVSPIEVEAVVREVVGVRDVAVVGHASSLAGYLVKAVIEPMPGADPRAVRAGAIALCGQRLPSHMIPRMFEFVDKLPTTITQKQSRLQRG